MAIDEIPDQSRRYVGLITEHDYDACSFAHESTDSTTDRTAHPFRPISVADNSHRQVSQFLSNGTFFGTHDDRDFIGTGCQSGGNRMFNKRLSEIWKELFGLTQPSRSTRSKDQNSKLALGWAEFIYQHFSRFLPVRRRCTRASTQPKK
jgi:hypothetical protein